MLNYDFLTVNQLDQLECVDDEPMNALDANRLVSDCRKYKQLLGMVMADKNVSLTTKLESEMEDAIGPNWEPADDELNDTEED